MEAGRRRGRGRMSLMQTSVTRCVLAQVGRLDAASGVVVGRCGHWWTLVDMDGSWLAAAGRPGSVRRLSHALSSIIAV